MFFFRLTGIPLVSKWGMGASEFPDRLNRGSNTIRDSNYIPQQQVVTNLRDNQFQHVKKDCV